MLWKNFDFWHKIAKFHYFPVCNSKPSSYSHGLSLRVLLWCVCTHLCIWMCMLEVTGNCLKICPYYFALAVYRRQYFNNNNLPILNKIYFVTHQLFSNTGKISLALQVQSCLFCPVDTTNSLSLTSFKCMQLTHTNMHTTLCFQIAPVSGNPVL